MDYGLEIALIFLNYAVYKRKYLCSWKMHVEVFQSEVAQFSDLSSDGSDETVCESVCDWTFA